MGGVGSARQLDHELPAAAFVLGIGGARGFIGGSFFIARRSSASGLALLSAAVAIAFSLLKIRVHFLVLGRFPGLVWSSWSLAAASWAAVYVMSRRIRRVGL